MNSLQLLNHYWGYSQFRPLQEAVINQVLSGKDTLALLATGAGKSICYQIPALQMEGVTLVISPLIALMKDQVAALKDKGIKAEAIYAGMPYRAVDRIFDNAVFGGIKLLYLSPERLASELAIARIQSMNINLIAVDEAHCISQWGYDFRPSYLRISAIRDLHPKASVLAVTATATKEVAADIQNHLKFSKENTFSSSFARPNISFQFEEVEAKENSILKHLNPKESSIIYVNTRRQTKLISEHLVRNGFSADYYHAGLDQKDRLKKQEAWTSGQLPAMVSTNAFGMGIDKAAVRKVIHLHIPRSVEAYFQEAGRAGRDGRSSKAILLYYQEDEKSLLANIEKSYPPLSEVRKIYQSLGNYLQLASGAGAFESFDFDLADFSNKMDYHQLEVFNAIQILERAEYIALSEQNWKSSTVQFKTSSRHLIAFQNQHVSFAKLIKALLRTYQHIGQEPTYINEGAIGRQIESSYERVVQLLTSLQKENIIDYVPRSELPQITFLKARLPNAHLSFDHLKYKEQKASKLKSAKAMLRVISSRSCRQRTILAYFGEVVNEDCGHCDNCLSGHAKKVNYEAIIQQIKSLPPGSILEENVDEIVMNYLLDEKVIYRKGPQYLRR